MATEKESGFTSEVEKRLNSIFGEETPKPAPSDATQLLDSKMLSELNKEADKPLDTTQKMNVKLQSEQSEDVNKPSEPILAKSSFTGEVEKRLDSIFGGKTTKEAEPGVPEGFTELPTSSLKTDFGRSSNVAPKGVVAEKAEAGVPEGFTELPTSSLENDQKVPFSVADLSSLVEELKSSVLSIEWEITDQIMAKFDDQINNLLDRFAENKVMQGFLRILRFLGRYIKIKKKDAHPASGKLLLSIFESVENILSSPDMKDEEKSSILLEDIKKYRDWVVKVNIA